VRGGPPVRGGVRRIGEASGETDTTPSLVERDPILSDLAGRRYSFKAVVRKRLVTGHPR
jgi:hypothetical protein